MTITYADLRTKIQSHAENDGEEFVAELDGFISRAEARLSRDLIIPSLSKHQTSSFTISDPFLSKPGTIITFRHLTVVDAAGERHPVEQRTVEFCNIFWPDRTLTDLPRFYAEWDEADVLVAPTPSAAFTVEASYKTRIPALSATVTTNFYSRNYEDLFLYACMREASAMNKDWAQAIKAYEEEYKIALATAMTDVGQYYTDETQTGAAA